VPEIQKGVITMAVYRRGAKAVFYMNFTINGIRVFKSTGKFTKKEAKHVEAMERQKMMDEERFTPQEKAARTLLSEALKQVNQARWKNKKDSKGPERKINRIIELIGDLPIGAINEDVVQDIITKLEATKISPASINRYLSSLKTLLRYKKQPWDYIRLRKEPKGRIRVITKEEEKQVLEFIRGVKITKRNTFYPETADLIEVLLDTAARLSEILDLKYEDINFKSNLISIWENKGELPRSVPMTKRVKMILESRQKINKIKPFTIDKHQAGHAWNWARKKMGFEKDKEFLLHALRHTCASRLVNKGVDLYVVKEYLGHSSIQVTERYAHLAPDKLAYAAGILEEYEE
jgi:integrase